MTDLSTDEEKTGTELSLRPGSAILWALGATFLQGLLATVTQKMRAGAASDLVNATLCHVLAHGLLLLLIFRVHAPEAKLREVLGLRIAWVQSGLALVAGAALYPSMSDLTGWLETRFPGSEEMSQRANEMLAVDSVRDRVVLVLALGLVIPVVEELFYRGAILKGLEAGRSAIAQALLTATIYALSKSDLRAVPAAFVLGLLLGWFRIQARSVWPSILGHVAFLGFALWPIVRGTPDTGHGLNRATALGGLAIGALCAVVGTLIARRRVPDSRETVQSPRET